METKNQTAQESAQSGVVDYAAALRQYHRYGRGRSMKKFYEDEGYDYWKFCKLAREGLSEMEAKIIADKHPVFIEVNPDGAQSSVQRDEPRKGIDGLCGIISEDLGHNPRKPKSVYVFSGRNPSVKKVLIREYNRYELTTLRLDEGRFLGR